MAKQTKKQSKASKFYWFGKSLYLYNFAVVTPVISLANLMACCLSPSFQIGMIGITSGNASASSLMLCYVKSTSHDASTAWYKSLSNLESILGLPLMAYDHRSTGIYAPMTVLYGVLLIVGGAMALVALDPPKSDEFVDD